MRLCVMIMEKKNLKLGEKNNQIFGGTVEKK